MLTIPSQAQADSLSDFVSHVVNDDHLVFAEDEYPTRSKPIQNLRATERVPRETAAPIPETTSAMTAGIDKMTSA